MRIGIDAMAFHGPENYLDMADLAVARGVDPAKYLQGIGQRQMAIATPCEDTVTMAVAAGRNALDAFGIAPEEIGTLIVGTETGVDHSKPVAVYVHELLGLAENCRTFETKHACYGAMAGLTTAVDWIAAGRARGRKALIIASDIARYGIGTAGEPTQGAGAVAMVVSSAPRLLELDPDSFGDYTRQVMDFWRPLYSKYAFADGHYSIACYLDALTGAWRDSRSNGGGHALGALDACFYHVPFTKMARKAHQRHWEVGHDGEIQKEDDEQNARLKSSYEQRVMPWLTLNADVGNIYTGSLFLALIDYLRAGDAAREGRTISLFSYGSGCGAAYCEARVAVGASAFCKALDPQPDLDARRRLTVDEYEALMHASENDGKDGVSVNPENWGLSGDVFYTGTKDHVRQYQDRRAATAGRSGRKLQTV